MRIVIGIAVALGIVILGLLGYAATRPDSFRVERKLAINAPPDKLFSELADFHRWADWSPWEKLDPAMQRTFSGAAAGPGAGYAWQGNDKVGAGSMLITGATPPGQLVIQLDFIKPFEGHNITEFTLQPDGSTTTVSWVMHGPAPFVSKLMGVFFDIDKAIGKDFEAGLANLKAVAEK